MGIVDLRWDEALLLLETEIDQLKGSMLSWHDDDVGPDQLSRISELCRVSQELPANLSAAGVAQVASVCEWVTGLIKNLAGMLAALHRPSRSSSKAQLLLRAACLLLECAAGLARAAGLERNAAFQLASAAGKLFQTVGQINLNGACAASAARPSLDEAAALLSEQCRALQATLDWLAAQGELGRAWAKTAGRPHHLLPWLADAATGVKLVAARAAAPLPPAPGSARGAPPPAAVDTAPVRFRFASLADSFVSKPLDSSYTQAIMQQPELQDRLLTVLLPCLSLAEQDGQQSIPDLEPARPKTIRSSSIAGKGSIGSSSEGSSSSSRAGSGGSGAAALAQGRAVDSTRCWRQPAQLRLLQQVLACVQEPCLWTGLQRALASSSSDLLYTSGGLLQRLMSAGGAAGAAGAVGASRPGSPQHERLRLACAVQAVRLLMLVSELVPSEGGRRQGRQPSSAPRSGGVSESTAWYLAALVPLCAAVVQQAEAAGMDAAHQRMLQIWATQMVSTHARITEINSPRQISCFTSATSAALCLLPQLARQHAAWGGGRPGVTWTEPLPPVSRLEPMAAAMLAGAILEMWRNWGRFLELWRPAEDGEDLSGPCWALWALHATACRLTLWCAADGGAAAVLPMLGREGWQGPLWDAWRVMALVARAATITLQLREREAGRHGRTKLTTRQLQAMAAANCKALPALARLIGCAVTDPRLMPLLYFVASEAPLAASYPSGLLQHVAAASWPGKALPMPFPSAWGEVLASTTLSSRGFAILLANGTLAAVVGAIDPRQTPDRERLRLGLAALSGLSDLETEGKLTLALLEYGANVGKDPQRAAEIAARVASLEEGALCSPACVALSLRGAASSPPCCQAAAAQHAAAIGAALQALEGAKRAATVQPAGPPRDERDALLASVRAQMPAAAQLACALLLFWVEPEQQAAARLELGRVCAVRSCAYLGCSNLSAFDSEFSGQVTGSRLCGGCRAVRYCSAACSRADWRAGHRRVCETLATERQAKLEAERRARQETED